MGRGRRNQTTFSQPGAPARSLFRSRSEPGKARNPAIASIGTDESYTKAGVGVISSEMYEALLLANVPKDEARAAAAEVAKGQDLASKSDLFELGAQLRSEMAKRFGEMAKRFGEIDKRFGEIDKRFGEMAKRFGEIDKRFGEIEKSLALLKFAVFSGGSIILVLLIKLVFIP